MQLAIKFLTAVDVLVALILIGLILIQRSKSGGGLGGLAGGGATEEVFGSGAGNIITRGTIGFAIAFFVITLSLSVIQGRMSGGGSVMDEEVAASLRKKPATELAEPAEPADDGDTEQPAEEPSDSDSEPADDAADAAPAASTEDGDGANGAAEDGDAEKPADPAEAQ